MRFCLKARLLVVLVALCVFMPIVTAEGVEVLSWTSPTTNWLRSVFMVSADDGWAVGNDGTIIRWDGTNWNIVTSPTTQSLLSVFMVSSTIGWAVGNHGTIIRWDGTNWSEITSPTSYDLESVFMLSADDGWAVGYGGTIIRWTGTEWIKAGAATYTLTVNIVGSGDVTLNPDQVTYAAGTEVELTASASSGWRFSHWLFDSVNVGSASPYTVTMNDDHSVTAVFTEVTQDPPVSSFTYSPPNPMVNDTITFDASGCSDADGIIVSYLWDFGDGDTSTSQNPTHAYDQEGSYTVTLTVTDDDGLTDTATKTISDVIPEFPTWTILPLFAITTLAVMIYRKKLTKKSRS
jgi:chitodextrinase